MKLVLYDFLRIGHIKRWHNVNTIRQQTVAEHTFIVMVIVLHLYYKMARPGERGDLAQVLVAAMFHDAPEAAGGDVPTPSKILIRMITKDPDVFAKLDDLLMPGLPYVGGPANPPWAAHLIKMADVIEGYMWIHDNGAGTHAQAVVANCRRRLEDLVAVYDLEEPEAGWYPAVNEVLMAMGVPYVHKESRISPP